MSPTAPHAPPPEKQANLNSVSQHLVSLRRAKCPGLGRAPQRVGEGGWEEKHCTHSSSLVTGPSIWFSELDVSQRKEEAIPATRGLKSRK